MYDIYKNALLNISADDSPDGRFGCFRDRDPLAVLPINICFRGQENWKCWLTQDTHAVFNSITKSPLAKRGWVFQERQLSRRVLHFTSHELMWECCAEAPYFASETFPGGTPFKSVFNGKPKFQAKCNFGAMEHGSPAVFQAWNTICKEYSGKAFSHVKDKLVALSGLAQEFEVALPDDTYLAGIWRSTLPQSLLWQSSGESRPVPPSKHYLAPTWSWLSIDGPISPFHLDYSGSTYSLVNIVDVKTTAVFSSKRTASLKDASITMRCFMRPVEIRPDYKKKPWYMLAMGGGKAHELVIKDEDGEETSRVSNFHSDAFHFSFDIKWDQDMESGPEVVAGYFVPLKMNKPTENSSLSIQGLLVEPVGGDGQVEGEEGEATYRRIGVLSVFGPHCQRIKYKLVHDGTNEGEQDWDRLLQRLRVTHQSFEDLKRAESKNESEGEVKSEAEGEAEVEAEKASEEINTKVIEADSREQLSVSERGAQIDISLVGVTERLYAFDEAVDEELGKRFERLDLKKIKLV